MKEKISVIVPVYNVEPYIEKCLHSIVSQTFKELEILVIDDGSTDKSGWLCDEYAKADSRIKVFHTKNRGLSCARNLGLFHAAGNYVSFVDSDDFLHPDFYKLLYRALSENQADIAAAGHVRVKEGNEPGWMTEKNPQVHLQTKKSMLAKLCYEKGKYELVNTVIVMNKLYKREIIGNLQFRPHIIHEDEAFSYYVLKQAERIVTLDAALYAYVSRTTSNSITGSGMSRNTMDKILFFDERSEDLKSYDLQLYIASLVHQIKLIQNFYVTLRFERKENTSDLARAKELYEHALLEWKKYSGNKKLILQIRIFIFKISPFVYWKLLQQKRQLRNMLKVVWKEQNG